MTAEGKRSQEEKLSEIGEKEAAENQIDSSAKKTAARLVSGEAII